MLVSIHIILSFITSIILYPFLGFYTIIFFFSAFLVDVDHYIEYSLDKKDISLYRAYKHFMQYHNKNKENIKNDRPIEYYKLHFHLFHFIEIIVIILVLGIFYKIFFYIALGMVFHIILDLISYLHLKYIKKAKLKHCGRYYFITHFLLDKITEKA